MCVNLVLVLPDGTRDVIEVKRSLTPKFADGFQSACEDLETAHRRTIYPGHPPLACHLMPGLCLDQVIR